MNTKGFGLLAAGVAVGYVLSASTPLGNTETVIGIGGNGTSRAHKQGYATGIDGILARDASQGATVLSVESKSSFWPDGPYTADESIHDMIDNNSRLLDSVPEDEYTVIVAHSLGGPAAIALAGRVDKVVVFGGPNGQHGPYAALPGIYPGASSPGAQELPDNVVNYCHQYDGGCDSRRPWQDPAYFAQSMAGLANIGGLNKHYYSPDEADYAEGLAPGDYVVPGEAPLNWLPGSSPTGLPDIPQVSLPAWEPGPLPSFTPEPYTPTELREWVPEQFQSFIPQDVLSWTPPALPVF